MFKRWVYNSPCSGLVERHMQAIVVVLGDLSRSPRMLYHVHSLLESGAVVRVICQLDGELPWMLQGRQGLNLKVLPSPRLKGRHALPAVVYVVYTAWRLLHQAWGLVLGLLGGRRPDFILLQTPPALPSLMLCSLAARIRKVRLLVDWHNLGDSILAMRLGKEHRLVRWAGRHERAWGGRADAHLTVSNAMRDYLQGQGIGPVCVLRDCAPDWFRPTMGKARLLQALAQELPPPVSRLLEGGPAGWPGILVSSSSWTADEDFNLLLDALRLCSAYFRPRTTKPALLILLTGSGAGRERFEQSLARSGIEGIAVHTLWVSTRAYPRLLAIADLGLCLHRSSSGLDLPMKIADMWGAGIPVCAFDYGQTLREVLVENENGVLFNDAGQLADRLCGLFTPEGAVAPSLRLLGEKFARRDSEDWGSRWRRLVPPLLESPS